MGNQQPNDSQQPPIDKQWAWVSLFSQKTLWSNVQQHIETAALLTPCVAPSGWYMYPANLSKQIIPLLHQIVESPIKVSLTSESVDCLVAEFFGICEYDIKNQVNSQIISFKPSVLKQVNQFINSRGSQDQWNEQDYLRILNHNLIVITQRLTKDQLPSNQNISIELIYGLMISYYGKQLLEECPQLAILMVTIPFANGLKIVANQDFVNQEPKKKKLFSLIQQMETKNNIPLPNNFLNDKHNYDEAQLCDVLTKHYESIKDDKQYSKKSRHRLKKIVNILNSEKLQLKQDKYIVRLEILTEHFACNNDYRLQDNWETLFYEALNQSLNRLPTDITVYNNGTLRDVKKHLLYHFLCSRSQQLQNYVDNTFIESVPTLEHLAQVVRKARKLGYFVSDWQNKLARKWSKLRSIILQKIKKVQKEIKIGKDNTEQVKELNLLVPPPLQYCLALDLNPQAHPFSFTYGRSQGYCLDYDNSLQWYLTSCNKSEKGYFYSIMANPYCHPKFEFLTQIPPQLREYNPQKQTEKQFMDQLDKWLVNLQENNNSNIYKSITNFINQKRKELPQYIQNKITSPKIISAISLFDSVFWIHYPEEVYLDKTDLPYPQILEDINQQSNSYNESQQPNKKYSSIEYWGPPHYGGRVN